MKEAPFDIHDKDIFGMTYYCSMYQTQIMFLLIVLTVQDGSGDILQALYSGTVLYNFPVPYFHVACILG